MPHLVLFTHSCPGAPDPGDAPLLDEVVGVGGAGVLRALWARSNEEEPVCKNCVRISNNSEILPNGKMIRNKLKILNLLQFCCR